MHTFQNLVSIRPTCLRNINTHLGICHDQLGQRLSVTWVDSQQLLQTLGSHIWLTPSQVEVRCLAPQCAQISCADLSTPPVLDNHTVMHLPHSGHLSSSFSQHPIYLIYPFSLLRSPNPLTLLSKTGPLMVQRFLTLFILASTEPLLPPSLCSENDASFKEYPLQRSLYSYCFLSMADLFFRLQDGATGFL